MTDVSVGAAEKNIGQVGNNVTCGAGSYRQGRTKIEQMDGKKLISNLNGQEHDGQN